MTLAVLHLGRTGAGPLFALELARALDAVGEDVVLVYSADAEAAPALEALDVPSLGVPTFRGRIGAVAGLARIGMLRRRIERFLRDHGVTSVIVAMEQVWQAAMAPSLHRAFPVALVVHDGSAHDGEQSRIADALHRREQRAADVAVTLSAHVAEVAAASGAFAADRIVVAQHPAFRVASSSVPRTITPDAVAVVGFFGRMSRYKGLHLGADAVAELRRRGHRVRFHIAGAGVPDDVSGLDHPDTLVEDRWIPQDEVEEVLGGFDVALLPYTEASQSGVLAYAMPLGVPAIVTPVGGLAEQARAAGGAVVAEAVTPDAVADALERLLTEDGLYARLSEAALDGADAAAGWQELARAAARAARRAERIRGSSA